MLRIVCAGALLADDTPCVTCHQEQHQRWQQSHHDLAFQHASDVAVKGRFDGRTFRGEHEAITLTKDGEGFWAIVVSNVGKEARYPVWAVLGTHPLQQYLVSLPDGRKQMLPVAWDTRPEAEGGRRWIELYPVGRNASGDRLHWRSPLQNWNGMCADCHATAVTRGLDLEDNAFDTGFMESNVSCTACHAVDAGHEAGSGVPDAIRKDLMAFLHAAENGRWDRLPEQRTASWSGPPRKRPELEVCAGCHSLRQPLDDTPGHGAFLDRYLPTLMSPESYFPDGQIKGEAYVWGSFLQSRMHDAGVTCSDCHDPHSLKLKAQGNGVCTGCHAPATYDTQGHHHHDIGSAGSSCANCHMPERTYMQVDPRRDHSIRVPRPDMTARFGTPNACNNCHAAEDAAWAETHLVEWYGPPKADHHDRVVAAFSKAWQGDRAAATDLMALAGDEALPAFIRASALATLAPWPSVDSIQAIAQALQDTEDLVRLGAVMGATNLPLRVRRELLLPRLEDARKAVRIEAARRLADMPAAMLPPSFSAAWESAATDLVVMEQAGSWRGEGGLNLGIFQEAQGRPAAARKAYQLAVDVDPAFSPARINLAALMESRGDREQAIDMLRAGLATTPDDPALNHVLGLMLIRAGQRDAALPFLKAATRAAPDNTRMQFVYGAALANIGMMQEALDVYRKGLEVRPDDIDLLYAYALALASEGRPTQAKVQVQRLLELAPGDSRFVEFLRMLDNRD